MVKTSKYILCAFLFCIALPLFSQDNLSEEKFPAIKGLVLIDILSPIAEIGELHLGYEIALNRTKKASVLFEGFVGLSKRNLVDEAAELGEDQRLTKFDPSKRNFGLGVHLRKYGFDAPYSWYIGLFSSFKRYHFNVTEGNCEGSSFVGCPVSLRSLNVKFENFRYGVDLGFNKKITEKFFLNVSLELGGQRIFSERSIPYDFVPLLQPFGGTFDRSVRDLLRDPGGRPDGSNRRYSNFQIALAFAIR